MRAWLAAPLALLTLAGCTVKAPPDASPVKLPAATIISAPIAAPAGCREATGPFHPAEPSLAVDPKAARHLVATWQELGSPMGLGNVVAISQDGGRQWVREILPGLTRCTGAIYTSATDPWVSIGPDHNVYLSSLLTRPPQQGSTTHDVVVSVLRDGAADWRLPVIVETQPSPTVLDKEAILADPRRPGWAYLVWAEYGTTGSNDPSVDQVFFSRTSDGGSTWSSPAPIYGGGDEAQQNQLLMTADGTLLDVFVEGASLPGDPHPPPIPVAVRVIRSKDQGTTWSQPIEAARFSYTNAVDPGSGSQLRFFGQDITAAAAGNTVYVSWEVNYPGIESAIWLARSEDRGAHWSQARAVVREKPEAFLPTLAVAGDTTVGVLWFDFRAFSSGSGRLDTDVWFSSSKDHAAHWTTHQLAGPFDLRAAPSSRYGPFLGDYMGLVGLPDGFAAAFVQARPASRNGPTDVFFLKIPG
ncbi:MAG: glycoside hydrolase [Candidatus Dormibacteraeota bacterium]|nr:glycoside hydrolase [Candidatus Dormibacteraeota bacterium]